MLGRFRLDIRKDFLTEMIVKHWHRLPKEVVELLPWGCLKHIDVVLGDMVLVLNMAVVG